MKSAVAAPFRLGRFRRSAAEPPAIRGRVRLGRTTHELAPRLRPGDIAVIDHVDLDRAAARALLDSGAAAVVNTARFISGRYPNLGPELLAEAGVTLVDHAAAAVFTRARDGERLALRGGALYRGEDELARGSELDAASIELAMTEARAGLAARLRTFASASTEYLRRQGEALIEGVPLPTLATPMSGRHVLVVTRCHRPEHDLARLRGYIRHRRPVLVAAGGGERVLRRAGLRPDLVIRDSSAPGAAERDAQVLVHRGGTGGADDGQELRFGATGVDAAVLLAEAAGAELIVLAGGHHRLLEFVDSSQEAMAGMLMARLRAGCRLVDAPAVAAVHRGGVSTWAVLLLLVCAVAAVGLAAAASPAGSALLQQLPDLDAMTGWVP